VKYFVEFSMGIVPPYFKKAASKKMFHGNTDFCQVELMKATSQKCDDPLMN
jgi:hypothetical protein